MVAIAAAVAKNNVIGNSNDLPWYLPEDLKRFKQLTTGHVVIMGRNTYESIVKRLGFPLPNRKNVVITSHADYPVAAGVEKYAHIKDALTAHPGEDIFLIGGQRIFAEGIEYADTMYLTELFENYDGDVYFPKFDRSQWSREVTAQYPHFEFTTYRKLHA